MTNFFSSVLLTIVLVSLLAIIRSIKGEMALPISICIAVFLVGLSIAICQPLIKYISNIVEPSSESYITLLFKAVGISLVASTASDICRECGENTIASKVELFGKCEILFLSLPLLKEITSFVTQVLQE